MKYKRFLFLIPVIALVAASCNSNQTATNPPQTTDNTNSGSSSGSQTQQTAPAVPTTLTVALGAQNNSKESGTATLTEANGQVTVVLNITGQPKNVSQPAHIHSGSCAQLGDIAYPLNSPKNGTSTTVINTTMAQLLSQPMAVNVHKSAPDINTYVACGDLVNPNTQ